MELLNQARIIKNLRENGARISREELREYLKQHCGDIDGLDLNPRKIVDDNGVPSHWYEIVSEVSQESANRLVAEQFMRDRE